PDDAVGDVAGAVLRAQAVAVLARREPRVDEGGRRALHQRRARGALHGRRRRPGQHDELEPLQRHGVGAGPAQRRLRLAGRRRQRDRGRRAVEDDGVRQRRRRRVP
ncbi:MAG: hypothetical protein ACK559_06410, partial [bacterium]